MKVFRVADKTPPGALARAVANRLKSEDPVVELHALGGVATLTALKGFAAITPEMLPGLCPAIIDITYEPIADRGEPRDLAKLTIAPIPRERQQL